MPLVLIVDDNPMDRELAAGHIREFQMDVSFAENGRAGLESVRANPPDVVLTDLDMPEMNGLELVRELKAQHAGLPVILMTAKGSETIAGEALRAGASSYVPKRDLNRVLRGALETVLAVAVARRQRRDVFLFMISTQSSFRLGYEPGGVSALISYVQDGLRLMQLCDERGQVRVGTALTEAIVNAIEHGNLELDSKLLDDPMSTAYGDLREQRKSQAPYRDRKVDVTIQLSRERGVFVVRDEGPGFDVSKVPDPTDPANLMRSHGRGILLIRTFMTSATYNATGNELTMTLETS